MKTIFGGFLEYISDEKLIAYTEAMDKDMAINMVEAALQYGVKSGLYNLEEAYCAYMCLKRAKFYVQNYGNGFKGPSRVATVELDGDRKE